MLQGSEPKPGRGRHASICHNRQPFQLYVQQTVVIALCGPKSLANHRNWSTAKSSHAQTGGRNALLPADAIPQFAAGSGKISKRNTFGSQPYQHGWRWRQFYGVNAGLA
jgi:hypothetical protein